MTQGVDVSVIIPAWRAEAFIHKAISSALSQTGVSLEVIVVDDASPDDTASAAERAGQGDDRLKVIRQSENGGPSVARNTAFNQARGRYLAILDADDSFADGRLADLVQTADQTHADVIVDNLIRVNAAQERIDNGCFLTAPLYSVVHRIELSSYVSQNNLMARLPALGYLKPLFRRDFIEHHSLAYDVSLRNSEDYYLVADMLALGAHMVFMPLEGYLYQVDAGSISHRLTPALTKALLDAEDAFLQRHQERFDKAARKALKRRQRRLRHVHAFVVLVERLKSRRLPSALAVVAKHPGAVGFISTQLGQIALQKITKNATPA